MKNISSQAELLPLIQKKQKDHVPSKKYSFRNALFLLLCLVVFIFSMSTSELVEARRLGGGRSIGRASPVRPRTVPHNAPTSPASNQAANSATNQNQSTPAARTNSWGGPLAGLAAGLGIAALASHFGFGQELSNLILSGILIGIVFFIFRLFSIRSAQKTAPTPAPVGTPNQFSTEEDLSKSKYSKDMRDLFLDTHSESEEEKLTTKTPFPEVNASPNTMHFTAEEELIFLQEARKQFIQLQKASDQENLITLKEYTTPRMFTILKEEIEERRGAKNNTSVLTLEPYILSFEAIESEEITRVCFKGLIRENTDENPSTLDEIWIFVRPADKSHGWLLDGIEQGQQHD